MRKLNRRVLMNAIELELLERGALVYLTTWVSNSFLFSDAPALTVGVDGGEFVFVFIDEDGVGQQGRLPIDRFRRDWEAEIDLGFAVKTPEGLLAASPDLGGQGIVVYRLCGDGEDVQTLAWTGYDESVVPAADAGAGPIGLARSLSMVPLSRFEKVGEGPVLSRDEVTEKTAKNYVIIPGLSTCVYNNAGEACRIFYAKGGNKA